MKVHSVGLKIKFRVRISIKFYLGFTVSDWEDIVRLHTRDKLAETPEEAVRIAVMAGIDMSMVGNLNESYKYKEKIYLLSF